MAEPSENAENPPKKKSKLLLILIPVVALAVGGAGFFATYSGMILGDEGHADEAHAATPLPDIAFVPVDPLVITLGPGSSVRHLRLSSQLEVAPQYASEVALLMPRILDVMNGYLRAVALRELEDPSALVRLRAQMLRRIQIVSGEGRVRDLLITEFVLN